ncbi:MAG: hypothetical protein J6C03_00655 [Clostridia bacterium]|nr:hypothetical protein [Clostridia bacterium]
MNIAKFTKNFFILIVGMLVVAILGRIYMMEDNDHLSYLFATDNAKAAYSENEAAFLYHKPTDNLSNDGYYSANGFIYNADKKELQITARYNDSLYVYLGTEDKTEFTFTVFDKTTETEYEAVKLQFGEKYMYNYEKLVVEDIEINDDTELYLILHFEDKYPVEEDDEGLIIHGAGQPMKAYKLSKADKEALKAE